MDAGMKFLVSGAVFLVLLLFMLIGSARRLHRRGVRADDEVAATRSDTDDDNRCWLFCVVRYAAPQGESTATCTVSKAFFESHPEGAAATVVYDPRNLKTVRVEGAWQWGNRPLGTTLIPPLVMGVLVLISLFVAG